MHETHVVMAVARMKTVGINQENVPRVEERFLECLGNGYEVPYIVSAANVFHWLDNTGNVKTITVPGPRHFDQTMVDLMQAIRGTEAVTKAESDQLPRSRQGFIDQFGTFWSRTEAYRIAKYHNQIRRQSDGWPPGKLFSEHLY